MLASGDLNAFAGGRKPPCNAERLGSAVTHPKIGAIAAAGPGTRLHPKSRHMPKVLLEVGGKPLLVRQLEVLRDAFGIETVYLIVGHRASDIRDACGDGSSLGLSLNYLENPTPDAGLGTALLVLEKVVDEPFVLLLGDEVYLESNHAALGTWASPYTAVCGIHRTDDLEVIRRNYSVELDGERITALCEKPQDASNPFVGCGTYLFAPTIFRFAHETPKSPRTGGLELTDVIDRAARADPGVFAFEIEGKYVNVNTPDDLNLANYLCRAQRFGDIRVSLVVPAYNEADSIGLVLREFRDAVHEIVVMDNESPDGTGQIARDLGATVHSEPLAGYGDALRKGMDAASGDILVLVEADASFSARDLGKFLEYLKDADMVIGTRTTRQLVQQGANMDGLLRWGNVAVGKFIEILWWGVEPRFTDVGCTYRAIWRETYQRIRPHLGKLDAAFSPEMMIEVLRARGRVIEIPVSYYRRRGGVSKHSSSLWHSVQTGLKMVRLILEKRFNVG